MGGGGEKGGGGQTRDNVSVYVLLRLGLPVNAKNGRTLRIALAHKLLAGSRE